MTAEQVEQATAAMEEYLAGNWSDLNEIITELESEIDGVERVCR
jgi:uncharacterized protein Yka (UPF0111/DUF47 family)